MLRALTLALTHPMLSTERVSAEEIVKTVLHGISLHGIVLHGTEVSETAGNKRTAANDR
jgi:hypothetical protein